MRINLSFHNLLLNIGHGESARSAVTASALQRTIKQIVEVEIK